jgi:LacI family transcriptional regulator
MRKPMIKSKTGSKPISVRAPSPASIGVRDIAKFANVSVGTVDRALNNRAGINPKTREHILEIARQHGYSPNLTARALSFGKSVIRVGLCIPREIHYFYDQVHAGFMDEARRHQHIGLQTIYRPVKMLQSPVKRSVRQLLDAKVDALVLTPGQTRQAAPLIAELEQEHNVRVVCVATDDSQSARSSAVCVDPVINGSVAAELMAKLIPAGAKVAVLTGNFDTEDHVAKVRAFCTRFPVECRDGRIVETIEGFEDEEEIRKKTVKLLRSCDDLAGIYISTVNCMPVCQAVEAAGKSGKIRIISTDVFPEVMPFFIRNTLSAAIYQNPYRQGQLALQLILDHFVTGTPFPLSLHLNPVIALRSNLTLFREMRGAAESSLMESY